MCYTLTLSGAFSDTYGWIPEWPKGTDCKSAANCFGGSNPPPPIKFCSLNLVFGGRGLYAGVAELADAQDLKSCRSNTVPVRFRSPALLKSERNIGKSMFLLFFCSKSLNPFEPLFFWSR